MTGAGVKVGWIADSIDVENPDFIRPDGTHVISEYIDFSGDGLNSPTDARESFGDASRTTVLSASSSPRVPSGAMTKRFA